MDSFIWDIIEFFVVEIIVSKMVVFLAVPMTMAAVAERTIATVDAPDFYWKYRLDRLSSKKSAELGLLESNYPEAKTAKDLYDAYYLDLTLQGKMDGFDWIAEKEVSDSEWISIYKSICQWSSATAQANKPDSTNLPSNDFDLLKQFYPQLNYRDLETPFSVDEVGERFPYTNLKEMMSAAVNGKLSVPGYSASAVSALEASDIRKELAAIKEASMKKVDTIFTSTMAYATNPFPDAEAKTHYQALKKQLSDFPQSPAAWSTFRANMEKEVDEMARLASKKEDEHHHHGHDEHDDHHEKKPSAAQEFEAKYGRNLDEMQERMNKFKNDPEGFLEASILEKYGKNGLEVWKKSQEFSEKMSVMSEADKAATESAFTSFLGQA